MLTSAELTEFMALRNLQYGPPKDPKTQAMEHLAQEARAGVQKVKHGRTSR